MIADNDPEEQEKIVKFSTLLANAVIFHTTLDMTMVLPSGKPTATARPKLEPA